MAAEALYDYDATSPEEASLKEGEMVKLLTKVMKTGGLIVQHDKCLMVPSNYVAVA